MATELKEESTHDLLARLQRVQVEVCALTELLVDRRCEWRAIMAELERRGLGKLSGK